MATTPAPGVSRATSLAERASYLAGNLGDIVPSTVIGSFLLLYLTDGVGLAPAAVGTLLLVARLVDAVTDPVMGYVVDHLPATRYGRFRPYLLVGSVLAASSFAALFLAPALAPDPLIAVWIAYLLWGLAFDLMDVPLNALLPAMTDVPRDRARLAGIKGLTYLFGAGAVTAAVLPAVDALGGGTAGWASFAVLVAAGSALLMAVAAAGVRERVRPVRAERYGWRDLGRMFFTGRAVPLLLTAKVAVSAASAAMLACMPFFFTYYTGSAALVSVAAVVMIGPMMAGSVAGPVLAGRLGPRNGYLVSIAVAAGGFASIALAPGMPGGYYLAGFAVAGLGAGGAVALNYVLVAELTDVTEWRTGFRAEAALASLSSFAAKAGGGIGGALTAYSLALTGYRAGQAQTETALSGLHLTQALLPGGLLVLGGLVLLAYPVDRAVAVEAMTALARRRSLSADRTAGGTP